MKKRRTTPSEMYRICYYSLCIAALFIETTLWLCSDYVSRALNIGTVVMMLFIVLLGINPWGRCGLASLERSTRELNAGSLWIREADASERKHADVCRKLQDDIFREETLRDAMAHYLRAAESDDANQSMPVRVRDYVSGTLMERTANYSFNEMVSGAMTGLGILGTFIGLTLGLTGFANGGTENIISMIPTLLTGIKVAFLTSIYGIIASLLYSFMYRRQLRRAEEALNDFVSTFRECVICKRANERDRAASEANIEIAGIRRQLGLILDCLEDMREIESQNAERDQQ